jgi:LysR family positive regulator for ilvC
MENKDLQLFLHLAGSLHFARTSEAMHVSPSTLSRIIKRLEDEIGESLFERDKRTVSLTQIGRQFEVYARQSLDQWQQFEMGLQTQSKELSGELRLYCSVTASYRYLSELLMRLRQQYPRIEITLRTGDPADAIPRVLNGEADIVIAARPDVLPSSLSFQIIGQSSLVFIAPEVPCAVQTLINQPVIDWQQVPMILSEAGIARPRVDRWFRQQKIKPNMYARVSGNEAIVAMVGLGFGVGVVPDLVLDSSPMLNKVRIVEVQPALDPISVGICSLHKRRSDPIVDAFWQLAGLDSV